MFVSLRLQAENVDWDVAAVLALNRDSFGPKGPLEVSSEILIQQATRGELQEVSQILQMSCVHPDVADSEGHTALIAATVTTLNLFHFSLFVLFVDFICSLIFFLLLLSFNKKILQKPAL